MLWRLNVTSMLPASSTNVALSSFSSGSLNTMSSVLSYVDRLLRYRHAQLGHANVQTIKKMVKTKVVLDLNIQPSVAINFFSTYVKKKQQRSSFPVNVDRI